MVNFALLYRDSLRTESAGLVQLKARGDRPDEQRRCPSEGQPIGATEPDRMVTGLENKYALARVGD